MVELATALMVVQTISLTVGVIYYIINLQNSNRNQQLTLKTQEQAVETRQGQLFMQIVTHINSSSFIDDYFTAMGSDEPVYEDNGTISYDSDTAASALKVGAFLEGIGSLVYRGLINPVFVSDLLNTISRDFWEKRRPYILHQREVNNLPRYGEYIEYLANELKKYSRDIRPELSK